MKLSVIIPAKDEEATLPRVLEDLNRTIPSLVGYTIEVICVDDHSRDRTAAIARGYGARVVENTRKPGKGNALRAGFEAATGELIMMMDADYSHRPTSYVAAQALARTLLAHGSNGLIYRSVRHPGGQCLACFRSVLVANVRAAE